MQMTPPSSSVYISITVTVRCVTPVIMVIPSRNCPHLRERESEGEKEKRERERRKKSEKVREESKIKEADREKDEGFVIIRSW